MPSHPSYLLAALLVAHSGTQAADAVLVPPDQPVAGLRQDEWSRAWWQWAASFEYEDSPVADRTGQRCAARQSGPVWFLAGTYGTRRTIRTCTVPAGKHLFFPLVNYVVMRRPTGATSCAAVTRSAAEVTEEASGLLLDVDGVRYPGLVRHRQATRECFDMGALTPGRTPVYPSAANGYYVMLRPLAPGRHTLNFGGVLPSMLQAVTYTLVVE